MASNSQISAKSVLGYVFLPRVIPRAINLFASGFSHVAYWMAQIYAMVGLIPKAHPYLQTQNIGLFGIRHVMGVAASNLKFTRKHTDQIIIFGATVLGAALILLQIISLVYSFLFRPALAGAGGGFSISFFNTPHPAKDIALTLLDRMFGIPKLFCNYAQECTAVHGAYGSTALLTPYHVGLHSMFQFYSLGILVVGVLIFLYFVVIVVGETATTGTPFGQRFQNVWVPVRLVMAIGLLLPMNHGLNSAQYITLYAAKWGSGFATNGWIQFNRALASQETVFNGNQFNEGGANPLGEKETLVAKPKSPDFTPVIQFITLAHACAYSYWRAEAEIFGSGGAKPPSPGFRIKPYFVKQPAPWMKNSDPVLQVGAGTTYKTALEFFNNADIVFRFGEEDIDGIKGEKGNIKPTCGELRMHISDVSNVGQGGRTGGPDQIQAAYFEMIKSLWFDNELARNIAQRHIEFETTGGAPCAISLPGAGGDCEKNLPPGVLKQELIDDFNGRVRIIVFEAWDKYRKAGLNMQLTEEIHNRGWGGAGIWYNTIARINGGFIDSINGIPSASLEEYPEIMVKVRKEREGEDNDIAGITMFDPNLKNGQQLKSISGIEVWQAERMANYYKYWAKDAPNQNDGEKVVTGNSFKDAMNMIFGTSGLFAMREENATIHPLAQLSALGKGLVDNAIRNIGLSSGFSFMGGILGGMDNPKGAAAAEIAGSVLSSTAFIGLTAGVIMFYILPFMPFLYFFFAVGEWVKGIFEAMVGVPLWALAHIRLDGEGLPGDAAANGYYLILEIFLRPILILFGLMAAITIFTAQVRILHFLWDIVVANLTGFEQDPSFDFFHVAQFSRGTIDQFFFTVIYAIIVYMLATASFKLIDSIPDNLMRYMGSSTPSFYDVNKDGAIAELNRYAATGGIVYGQEAVQNITQISGGLGRGIGGMLKGTRPPGGAPPTP